MSNDQVVINTHFHEMPKRGLRLTPRGATVKNVGTQDMEYNISYVTTFSLGKGRP